MEPLRAGPGRGGSGAGSSHRVGEGGIYQLSIRPEAVARAWKPHLGDSIAVDGCCLTIARPPREGASWVFHVIPETLSKTTLGELAPGALVHLERAAGASTLLDGHMVQGHIDGVARVISVTERDDWRIRLAPPEGLLPYIVPKGSVSLAGVSLTVAEIGVPARAARTKSSHSKVRGDDASWFEVALIPVTLDRTHLGRLVRGQGVNLECDPIAKAVAHCVRHFLSISGPRTVGGVGGKKRIASRRR